MTQQGQIHTETLHRAQYTKARCKRLLQSVFSMLLLLLLLFISSEASVAFWWQQIVQLSVLLARMPGQFNSVDKHQPSTSGLEHEGGPGNKSACAMSDVAVLGFMEHWSSKLAIDQVS